MRGPSGTGGPDGRQVCLIGCGVGALTAAACLRRHGHAPTLVVSPTPPADGRRALVLWAGAAAILDDVGDEAVASVLADGSPVRTWRSRDADGECRVEHARAGDPPAVVVDRSRVREALRGCLPSASLRVSKTPAAVEPSPDGPVVAFDDGVRERFDAVVGADGRRSWVRRAALRGAPRRPGGTTTWSFRSSTPVAPATLTGTWGDDGGLVIGPGARGRIVLGSDADATTPTAAVRGLVPSLPDGFDSGSVTDAVRLDDRVGWAPRWARDGVALLGDAAHAFHPALALGGSLAVADAATLAVAAGTAPVPAALRRYERHCRGRVAALARRVAAGEGVGPVPFPADDLPAVRGAWRALLGTALDPGPGPVDAPRVRR